jgi:positive regulator of sigma E activity
VFLWFLTNTITTFVFVLGIGLGLGIGFIIVVNEALILTTIQTLQRAGESVVQILSLRKNMRAVLAVWIFGLFTLVVVMTVFNQLELDKFTVIMGVLGSFVASVVAYYFATKT